MAQKKVRKRGKNEPVNKVILWKRLLKAKENHRVTFYWVTRGTMGIHKMKDVIR